MIHDQIISDLTEIIGNNDISKNVYETFSFAQKTIQNKDVILETNPSIDQEWNNKMANTILGGMCFRKDKTGQLYLSFGKKYLDTYAKNSSIHYTILMHEFKHLNDYFDNKNSFFDLNWRKIFQLQYELNAIKIESEFIKYYLVGNIHISKCENYILESYEKDNLESWTIYNRKESADIYNFFMNMKLEFEQNKILKKQLEKSLMEKADKLLEKKNLFMNLFDVSNNNGNNFSRYGHFIRLKTYEKYLRYIIFEKFKMKETLFEDQNFSIMYRIISDLLEKHDHANLIYSSGLDNYWENDFIE